MSDKLPVQIRTRKFIRNAVLARRQFVSWCPYNSQSFFIVQWIYYVVSIVATCTVLIPSQIGWQVIDVVHPGRANVSKNELKEKLAEVK